MPLTDTPPHLYYEDRGRGEPVLVINGFALASSYLEPLASAGSARARWIVYDHPGTGGSPAESFPCTTAQLARCALSVLDQLGIPAAHVAGMSLGGAVALELALSAPHRLRSLILIGTTAAGPLGRNRDLPGLALTTAAITTGSLARRRLWVAPALYGPGHRGAGTRRRPAGPGSAPPGRTSPWALLGQACAATLHDRSRALHRIEVPTLIVHGKCDVLLPVHNARSLADRIPHATLRIVEGAGHALALEQPDELAALVGEWVTAGVTPTPLGGRGSPRG